MKNIIKHDIYVGIICEYIKYAVAVVVMVILSYLFFSEVISYALLGKIQGESFSMGDMLIYWFRGMKEYDPKTKMVFDIPFQYIFQTAYLAFLSGNYPLNDLHGFGKNILIRTKNRRSWWAGKCIWNFMTVIIFYALLYVNIFIYCIINGKITFLPDFNISNSINMLNLNPSYSFDKRELVLCLIILPILTSIALNLFQMTLSFFTNSFISYIAVICIIVASAYYKSQFLVGNFLMVRRNAIFLNGGIDTIKAVIFDVIIIIASVILGYLYFKKLDVYSSIEEDEK